MESCFARVSTNSKNRALFPVNRGSEVSNKVKNYILYKLFATGHTTIFYRLNSLIISVNIISDIKQIEMSDKITAKKHYNISYIK